LNYNNYNQLIVLSRCCKYSPIMENKAEGAELRDFDYWDKRWKNNDAKWHRLEASAFLVAYQNELFADRTNIKVFLPLCGKSLDLKWLANLGHKVVGVECCSLPVESFFQEHHMEHVRERVSEQCTRYKSTDDMIHIYHCDLFHFTPQMDCQFDALWDRGSLVAINPDDRKQYVDLMLSLMHNDCRYLLNTVEYDDRDFKGPPSNVPQSTVHQLYGERCHIRRLCEQDFLAHARSTFSDNMEYYRSCLYVIKLK